MTNDTTSIAALRNTLLSNGFRPLPLIDKGIRIKGWTRIDIDQAFIDKYARTRKYKNTGIRCDNLVAFDIDVTDQALSRRCEQIVESICGPTEFCRVGSWPKQLLLYSLDGDSMRSGRTGKYGGQMVEVLAGHGRQFAAYGEHPSGKDYEWMGDHPATVPIHELPGVTAETAGKCMDELEAFLESTGLERSSTGHARGEASDRLDDLTDEFQILTEDGQVVTWAELKPLLDEQGTWGNIVREDGEFGDSNGVHFMVSKSSGEPLAHDFARDVTHYEPVIGDKLNMLDPPVPDQATSFDGGLKQLLEDYVLIGDGKVRLINQPEYQWDYAKFRLLNCHLTTTEFKGTKAVEVSTVDKWAKHPKSIRADVTELRPDHPDEFIIKEGKVKIFNIYNPPLHETGGELDTVMEFIEHLIPGESDRELFLDWHAHKVANPSDRMHALVMVTKAYGTGRGTWVQILQRLFGYQYVNRVELHELLGVGGQAEYNPFLADSLIVDVPEALEEKETQTRFKVRHLAYERLKSISEPQPTRQYIKRKYGANTFQWVYASLLICSNHSDALAIPEGDRRLVVIDNTEIPLTQAGDLDARVHAWKMDDRNIGALEAWFQERALSSHYDPMGDAPLTPAKKRMIESAVSDMDLIWGAFVESCEGAFCTPAQWRQFAFSQRMSSNYDVPENFDGALIATMKQHARRNSAIGSKTLKIAGDVYRVWVIKDFEKWVNYEGNDINKLARQEVTQNGDPAGTIVDLFPK